MPQPRPAATKFVWVIKFDWKHWAKTREKQTESKVELAGPQSFNLRIGTFTTGIPSAPHAPLTLLWQAFRFSKPGLPSVTMVKETQLALNDAAEWLGDWHPLAEQLGSADGLVELSSVSSLLKVRPVRDVPSLKRFLRNYQTQILLPLELPAIEAAHGHASRNELRELVALDQELAGERKLQKFAAPSRRVGQAQMQKLRPLRDQRVVQRYLNAVETGAANGWHTLVYGLTLAIYSLPLRQGLLGYAHQTMRSFIYSAAQMLELSERQCRELFDEICSGLPAAIEQRLQAKAELV